MADNPKPGPPPPPPPKPDPKRTAKPRELREGNKGGIAKSEAIAVPNDPKQSQSGEPSSQSGKGPTPDPKQTAKPRESQRDNDPKKTAKPRHTNFSEGDS
jgi:hypothetical protein